MSLPSVAIILATLDNERTVADCLRSVANLDWPPEDLDILVIDGGSRDDTLGLVRARPVRLFVRTGAGTFFRQTFAAGQTDAPCLLFLEPRCTAPQDWVRSSLHYLQFPEVAGVGVRALPAPGTGADLLRRACAARGRKQSQGRRVQQLGNGPLAVRRAEFIAAGGFREEDGRAARELLLRRLAGPPQQRRSFMLLERPDAQLIAPRTAMRLSR